MIRSNTVWLNCTSLIASSGISIERFANHPSRWMIRSLVTTKCDVSHRAAGRVGDQPDRDEPEDDPDHGAVDVGDPPEAHDDRHGPREDRKYQGNPVRSKIQDQFFVGDEEPLRKRHGGADATARRDAEQPRA